MAEGKKYDTGKPMMACLPPHAELEIAKVLTFGAEKYGRWNWSRLDNLEVRYMDAAMRHLNAYRRGELVDEETGLSHLAHAVCCLMFIEENNQDG